MLKAYMVHDGDPGEQALLVFADNGQKARVVGNGVDDIGCEGFLTVKAERRKDLDKHLRKDAAKPYVEQRRGVLRLAGWRWGGSEDCIICDLNGCDDPQFEPCEECHQCPECGHAADCANKACEYEKSGWCQHSSTEPGCGHAIRNDDGSIACEKAL